VWFFITAPGRNVRFCRPGADGLAVTSVPDWVRDSKRQEALGEGLLSLPVVVRQCLAGESAVAEDMVEVGHEGHRGLAGEQPVGAAVGEDEAVGRRR
jgi:hypothetical protein